MPMLRFNQINLQHSKTVFAALLLHLAGENIELVLVQKPWIADGRVSGLNVNGYRIAFE